MKFPLLTCKTSNDETSITNKNIDRSKFIDFHTIILIQHDQKVVWQIWDIQGQRFPSGNAYTSLNLLYSLLSLGKPINLLNSLLMF